METWLPWLAGLVIVLVFWWLAPKESRPAKQTRRSPVARIVPGTVPIWEIEALLARLRVRLARLFPGDAAKLAVIFDTTEVVFLADDDPQAQSRSWGVYRGGVEVRCMPGRGWRGRLCLALAHAFRLRLRGEADPLRNDHAWFDSFTTPEGTGDAPTH